MNNDNLKYKVCILAAGAGTRMGSLSESINKGILPVNHKAVISYIIEKFTSDVEIVVAVGNKKDTVVDYLTLAHPDRKFTFVEIDKFVGPGTGPGYSLLLCKEHLQCPFIFSTADTIVLEDIPTPKENWIGIAPVRETEKYCTVKIKNNAVYQLNVKIKTDNSFAFIGLAGIHNYKEFFTALEQDKKNVENELQMTTGLSKLIEHRLLPIGFTWFDTGTLEGYKETNKNFSGKNKFDFSKGDEFLYFVGNRVIKFFADKTITEKRHLRGKESLKGITPTIEASRGHFYSYIKVDGNTMYNVLNAQLVNEFLTWAKKNLWRKLHLTLEQKKTFNKACMEFYKDKTLKRIKMFQEKIKSEKEPPIINGVHVPTAKKLINAIDWKHIADGTPSNFHGDLQFDNILVASNPKTELDKFVLIDWRHEFGGHTSIGDLYYDLAKLYGGTILSYPLIKDGMFSFNMDGENAYYHFYAKNDLSDARERYEEFLIENNFDLKKIKTLTALIFLNMSPLHHQPFDLMLYHLGRTMLHKALKKV